MAAHATSPVQGSPLQAGSPLQRRGSGSLSGSPLLPRTLSRVAVAAPDASQHPVSVGACKQPYPQGCVQCNPHTHSQPRLLRLPGAAKRRARLDGPALCSAGGRGACAWHPAIFVTCALPPPTGHLAALAAHASLCKRKLRVAGDAARYWPGLLALREASRALRRRHHRRAAPAPAPARPAHPARPAPARALALRVVAALRRPSGPARGRRGHLPEALRSDGPKIGRPPLLPARPALLPARRRLRLAARHAPHARARGGLAILQT